MKKVIWISGVILAIEVIAAFILLPSLPEQIPIHWNINGDIDGYGAKWLIFMAPVLSAAMTFFVGILPRLDPKRSNAERSVKVYGIVILLLNLVFAVLFTITALASLNIPVSVNHILPPVVGVMLCGIGNYLPKVKQNYFLGIRLPWTLANETVWTKTHRLGGWLFMLDGVLFILAAFLPPPINFILPLAGIGAILVIVTLYAYAVFRKQPQNSD